MQGVAILMLCNINITVYAQQINSIVSEVRKLTKNEYGKQV
jgi:hypothetical protein